MNPTTSDALAELTRLKDAYHAAVAAQGRDIVDVIVKDFLADNPEVTGLFWTQYTPYFNDGEACVFGVGEVYLLMRLGERLMDGRSASLTEEYRSNPAPPGQVGYSLYDLYDFENHGRSFPTPRHEELLNAGRELERTFEAIEDVLLATFGDHASIVATAEGYVVDEYDHD